MNIINNTHMEEVEVIVMQNGVDSYLVPLDRYVIDVGLDLDPVGDLRVRAVVNDDTRRMYAERSLVGG